MSDVSPAAGSASQGPPPQIILQQAPPSLFGRYGKWLLAAVGLLAMSLVGLTANYRSYFSEPGAPQEKYHSLSKHAPQKIALVDISGTIMGGEGFVKQQLERIREDKQVVAVVLRIDSPGGTVTGSDYLYHHVRDLAADRELPLVVSMGSICASGGYYIAMAVGDQQDAIFAEPTTWTGSIGVVIPHYDFSEMLERFDVKDDSIASAKYKLMGSPTRQLDEAERAEERQLLQGLVDSSFERFKEVVENGRPKLKADPAALEKVTTGQIFTSAQALELGLVDQIGFVEEAIERAAKLAGKSPDKLRCVKYVEPSSPLNSLLSLRAPASDSVLSHLQGLLELAVPRAYYLCTWSLPGLRTAGQ